MRGLYPLRHRGPERVIVAGMFTTVNNSSPTAVRGQGFTVAWAAEGRWTVTLQEPVNAFDSIVVGLARETLDTNNADVWVDQDSIDTDSFEIRHNMNGALADDPGTMISFVAVCRIGNHNA